MNYPESQLLLVVGALATMTVAACYIHGLARVLLVVQAAQWSVSYVVRPVVLLWVQPKPRYGDSIADPRLAAIGYDHGIATVLRPVAFGLWAYALLVVAYAVWTRRRGATVSPRPADPNLVPTLWTVYVIGLLGRAASYVTGTTSSAGETQAENPLLHFVTLMAAMGSLGLIIFIRPASRRVTLAVISALTAMEFVWTVVTESKTPLIGAALAIAIRFALTGWTRVKVAATAAIAILGIGAFGWLQSFKQSDSAKVQEYILDSNYPSSVQPFLSILRRFDLLEAATDSYYMGGRRWLSPAEVVQNAAQSLVPSQLLGTTKFHAGTAWASDVRGASVDMTRVSVSLAEGNINEGFVLGGYSGVIVGVAFTFLLLLATVRALRAKQIVFVSLGLAMIGQPILFERGILGGMEVLGKSLQVVVLTWIIYLLIGEHRRRNERFSSAPHNFGIEPDMAMKAKGREMGLIDYLHIARRRWLIIGVTVLLGVAIAAAYSSTIPRTYEASSRMYVTMSSGTSVMDSYQGYMAAQERISSYANLATSSTVAQHVIDDLGLSMSASELQSKIKATFPPATALIDISVTDESAERAKLLTDKVVTYFRAMIEDLETTVVGGPTATRVTVVDPASMPTSPTSPNSTRILALGVLAGLVLGCLAAFVRDRFDRTLRTSNELAEVLPVPTLAIIDVGEPGAEGETQRLRARLTQAREGIGATALLVTSFSTRSQPDVAIRLSKALAETGRQVALVDADTTGHGSSERLPVVSDSGLAELLRTTSSPVDAFCKRSQTGISVLPLGAVDVHTSDLLASERFTEIVADLRDRFDYVVIEAAPVTSAADALAVSARCDGAVAVVELGTTTSHQVRGALATFEQGGSGLLGAVAISQKSGNWLQRLLKRGRRHVDHPGVPEEDLQPEVHVPHGQQHHDPGGLQPPGGNGQVDASRQRAGEHRR